MTNTIKNIQFKKLHEIELDVLQNILNKSKVRTHLMKHDHFDIRLLNEWINEKSRVDQLPGCRIRAVLIDQQIAGWCGIQQDNEGYELAIVIDDQYWGGRFKNI